MPSYLIQLSYAPPTIAALVRKPTNRSEVISTLVAKLGGNLVGSWMSFGEYDLVLVIDDANNVSAAACSMAVTASGGFTKFKTTPLLSMEESVAAMKQASSLGYTPPSA